MQVFGWGILKVGLKRAKFRKLGKLHKGKRARLLQAKRGSIGFAPRASHRQDKRIKRRLK